MWTENFQKYKLDFEGAEKLETKLLTSTELWRKPESSRKISTSTSLTMQKPLIMWTKNSQKYKLDFERGRETRDQIANKRWIMEKAREFQKNIYFCFIDYAKA